MVLRIRTKTAERFGSDYNLKKKKRINEVETEFKKCLANSY